MPALLELNNPTIGAPVTYVADGWPTGRIPPALLGGGVQVWIADVADHDEAALVKALSADELGRGARFHDPLHRRRYNVRRGLLRKLIAHYLGAKAPEIRFTAGLHGKPRLESQPGPVHLHFNISSAGDKCLFAFAADQELGVDIEAIDSMVDARSLMRRVGTSAEMNAWLSQPSTDRLTAFFHLWTRKEAYVKCTGQGVAADFTSIETAPNGLAASSDSGKPNKITLLDLPAPCGYVAALALTGRTTAGDARSSLAQSAH